MKLLAEAADGVEYRSGRRFIGRVHCVECGVHVYDNVYGPPITVFDKLPPERKSQALQVYNRNLNIIPLNLRSMVGVDLTKTRIARTDDGTRGYELDEQ